MGANASQLCRCRFTGLASATPKDVEGARATKGASPSPRQPSGRRYSTNERIRRRAAICLFHLMECYTKSLNAVEGAYRGKAKPKSSRQ
jgi:hypothetical protein